MNTDFKVLSIFCRFFRSHSVVKDYNILDEAANGIITMKDKRRNTEKRKEKSRDAARCRRGKETEVFFELASMLPLQTSVTSQLDKASVMRMSISFLKLRKILEQHSWSENAKTNADLNGYIDQLFPKALDGFVFILSGEGDIVYISESVSKYLGIQQLEMMGQSIFDFSHPRDEDEIHEALSLRTHGPSMQQTQTEERAFFLRMKCTLTSKGRNVNLKSASYKTIMCTGHLLKQTDRHQAEGMSIFSPYLMAIGEPIPHPANIEIPMDSNTFLSRHGMDMKFSYCDERVKELLHYDNQDLIGRSLYDFHHAVDSNIVEKAFKDLFSKDQTMTGRYRFLARGGGWVWVITQATVNHNSRNQKAQWVVCVHYVLSKIEHPEQILSEAQLPKSEEMLQQQNTESTFSRKTDDMEDGYYVPGDMKMIKKDDPEDLDYLAPTAGDGCMPLGFSPPWKVAMDGMRAESQTMSSPSTVVMAGLKREPGLSPVLCSTMEPGMSPAMCSTMEPGLSPAMCSRVESGLSPAMCSTMEPGMSPAMCSTMEPGLSPAMRCTIEPGLSPAMCSRMEPGLSPGMCSTIEPGRSPAMHCTMEPGLSPAMCSTTEPGMSPAMRCTMEPGLSPAMRSTVESGLSPVLCSTMEPGLSPALCSTREMQPLNTVSPVSNSSSRMSSPRDFPIEARPDGSPGMRQFFRRPSHPVNGNGEINLVKDVSLLCRAPFVQVDGHQNLESPSVNALLTMQSEVDPKVCGNTEYICRRSAENIFEEPPQPPKPSMRDMLCGSTTVASIDRPPDIMFEQIKPPFDINSLEKGPPPAKKQRLVGQVSALQPRYPPLRGSKMLLNLLVTGEDPSGYKMVPMAANNVMPEVCTPEDFQLPLACLTQHDCEVNAPTDFWNLLNGDDLLDALECKTPPLPH